VAVVSDSNAYLPKQLAEANGLTMLQQYVLFADGRRVHEDEVDLDSFFEEMRREQLPTTTNPTTEDFVAAYEEAGGSAVDRTALRWWLVAATLRWGVICRYQYERHRSGLARSVELAAIGRRVCETEYDLLNLLETT